MPGTVNFKAGQTEISTLQRLFLMRGMLNQTIQESLKRLGESHRSMSDTEVFTFDAELKQKFSEDELTQIFGALPA